MRSFKELFEKVYSRLDLSIEESKDALYSIMEGFWEPSQIGAFLTALHIKGETPNEVAGFALAMRDMAVPVPMHDVQALDVCGTGGDRKGSFNVSTIAALVLAGAGIPVLKHGNRAVSSRCGSADLLEALGIRCRLLPEEVAESVNHAGFAFLYAPDYHPATASVAEIRKQLGVPTIFNLLGPLTNPARPAAQLIGVYDRYAMDLMAGAIRTMDPHKRASLIHSIEGWDEATPSCDFMLYPLKGKPSWVNCRLFGIDPCNPEDMAGGSSLENARICLSVLSGAKGAWRSIVLLNATLAAMVYYPDISDKEALELVTQALDSGAGMNVVLKLREKFPGEAL
jgi:anthranilate phosphoribosyltransferase